MESGSTYIHRKGLSELDTVAQILKPTFENETKVCMVKKYHHWNKEIAYRMRKKIFPARHLTEV